MSHAEVGPALDRWSAAGVRAAVATLVSVRRSAPRPPGARFAVSEAGDLAGSISAGCVEGDLTEHLRQVLAGTEPAVLRYGITDEMAFEVGLACGGEIEVLIDLHDPGDPAWAALRDAVAESRPAALVTGVSPDVRSRRLLVLADGGRAGGLGRPDLDDAAAARAEPFFDDDRARLVDLAGERLLFEGFLPPPRLAIVGATLVGEALCTLASFLGYRVFVIDPRSAFADPERFPGAERVLAEWPEEGLAEAGLDRYTRVVVLTHDSKLDVPALAAALRAGARYVGLLGGRRTQELRRAALAELGLGEEELSRIAGPVGLDIGADTPREIALSIAAQIVAETRGRIG